MGQPRALPRLSSGTTLKRRVENPPEWRYAHYFEQDESIVLN
jgi:hypothetical protein